MYETWNRDQIFNAKCEIDYAWYECEATDPYIEYFAKLYAVIRHPITVRIRQLGGYDAGYELM